MKATIHLLTDQVLHRSIGGNVTLLFSFSDDDPPVRTSNIRWFLHHAGVTTDITNSSDGRHTFTSDRLSFEIDGITHTDEGEYTIQATNEAGISRRSVFVSLTSKLLRLFLLILVCIQYLYFLGIPSIAIGPEDEIRRELDDVTFPCFSTGDPPPMVQWTFNNTLLQSNNKYSIGVIQDGLAFGSLTVRNLSYYDRGRYTCTASNDLSSTSDTVELKVQGMYTCVFVCVSVFLCVCAD